MNVSLNLNSNQNPSRRAMTGDEVVARARANCMTVVRDRRAHWRTRDAVEAATGAVVETLRTRRAVRRGGVVLFDVEDCRSALRVADARVRATLAA